MAKAPTAQERTRRRFVRRQWLRRWLAWRPILAVAVVVALVGGGIYAVYFSSALQVNGVQIVGARTLDEATIEAVAAVPVGDPLATVDLEAIQARLEDSGQLAALLAADVSRKWPHEVRIEVTERTPVAVVERGGVLQAVDGTGVLFNTYRRRPPALPLIETSTLDNEALAEAAAVAAALPSSIAAITDHLELVSTDEINLELSDGRQVRWGSSEESAQKAEVLAALLDVDAQVYDVSVPGQPVTR